MLDASTVVSAALNPGGVPRQAVAAARSGGTIALSEAVFNEIAEVFGEAQILPDHHPRPTQRDS